MYYKEVKDDATIKSFAVFTKNLTERFHLLRWDMNVKTVYD